MVVLDDGGHVATDSKHRAPPQLHHQLALRIRDKSTSSLPISEPTTTGSSDGNCDSATAPRSESTGPTSVAPTAPRASSGSISEARKRDPGDKPKNPVPGPEDHSTPPHHGPEHALRPAHSRRREVVITDHRDRHPRRSHPIPYMGVYPRGAERSTMPAVGVGEPNSRPLSSNAHQQGPSREDEEEPRLRRWVQYSSGPRSFTESRRRTEEWVDDASSLTRRLYSVGEERSNEPCRYPQLNAKFQLIIDVLGGGPKSVAPQGPPHQRVEGLATHEWMSRATKATEIRSHTASGQKASGSASSTPKSRSTSSEGAKRRGKQPARGLDQIPEEEDNDEDNERNTQQPNPSIAKGKGTEYLFACPYFKHNPDKYVGKEWRSCCGPGWNEIRRMKEHLYGHHRQPKNRCRRCGECFDDEKGLDQHANREEACLRQSAAPVDGFDGEQEAQLRSRKRSFVSLSEVEKWRKTYTILFPHVPEEDIPSPYYQYVEVHRPSSLSDYENFAFQKLDGDLGPMLEKELEVDLGITEPAAKRRALEWLKSMNRKLIGEFREGRNRAKITVTPATPPSISQLTSSITSPAGTSSASGRQDSQHLEFCTNEMLFGMYSEVPYEDSSICQSGEPFSIDDFDLNYLKYLPMTMEVEVSPPDSGYGTMSTSTSTKQSGKRMAESSDEP